MKNYPTRHATCATARTREDTAGSLTRSDIPILVQEVVNTLTMQGNSQVAGQDINSEESSSSGTMPQTLALIGMVKNYCTQSIRSYGPAYT